MTYNITQTFDPSIGEYGQDYALKVGSPIYSPVSGTVGTEDKGKADWGKRLHVFLSNSDAAATGLSSFAVGHLTSFAVSAGQHVNAGDLVGYSGGATSDPSSGNSSGPHVEPQFFGLNGQPINPVDIFARFTSWEQTIFSGGASSTWRKAIGLDPVGSVLPQIDPLAGIPQAITSASNTIQAAATRAFWVAVAIVIATIGLFLIFAGDLEKLGDKVTDVAEKVAPEAALAA